MSFWIWRIKQGVPYRDFQGLVDRVKQLELQLDDVTHQLQRLDIKHGKLAGAYYRRFGAGEGDTSPSGLDGLSKAQIKARLGILPGRPVPNLGG